MIDYENYMDIMRELSFNKDQHVTDDNMFKRFDIIRKSLNVKGNASFFRYRSLENEYVFDEIEKQYAFMSPLDKFDDKYEGKYLFDETDSQKGICREWIDCCNYRYNKTLRVTCFTTAKDMMPFWYYYADKHTGICIEYKYREMVFDSSIVFLPVIYPEEDDRFKYKYAPVNEKDIKLGGIINTLIKHPDWKFENEWRAIRYQRVESLEKPMHLPLKVHAIHFGEDVNQKNVDRIKDIIDAHKYDIKLNRMKMTTTGIVSFNLEDYDKFCVNIHS